MPRSSWVRSTFHNACLKLRPSWRSVLLLAACVTALAGSTVSAPRALAYSCGTAGSGTHCYGEAITVFGVDVPFALGASVRIDDVWLQCTSCGGLFGTTAFIDNEMWIDAGNCFCWVEAGSETVSDQFSTSINYFWGDKRPVDCSSCFNGHLITDDAPHVGSSSTYTIKYIGNSQFSVDIWDRYWTPPYHLPTYYSTNNTMTVHDVHMGQELAGNAGASAPKARYAYRYYIDYNYNQQPIDGSYNFSDTGPPVTGYWPGDPGQDFYTQCGC